MMRCTLTLIVVVAAACLAAADYTVPIYSHHGKVSSVTQLNRTQSSPLRPASTPWHALCISYTLGCASCQVPHTYSSHLQPYDNGFYVGTQAHARIQKFLEVDDFYKSTVKPFWNSGAVGSLSLRSPVLAYETRDERVGQGRQVIMSWFSAVIWRTEFNDYVEELWGIADALNMSRLEVFALNCADDIDLYTRTPQGSWFARELPNAPTRASLKQVRSTPRVCNASRPHAPQCSDAVLPGALLWGHNEDAGMDIDMPDASTAYILNLTNSETGLRYTACAFPASAWLLVQ